MTSFTPISLEECPEALQAAVQKKREFAQRYDHEFCILSQGRKESTPYIDKTQVHQSYRVILNFANMISVLTCDDSEALKDMVCVNSILWGEVLEILRHPPEYSGLDKIRDVVLASDQAWQLS